MPVILTVIFGAILLFAGRMLFWLFLGIAGFIAGFKFAQAYFLAASPMMVFIVAAIFGGIGVVMAAFFQAMAISLAGFMTGAYLTFSLLDALGYGAGLWQAAIILLCGIIGAALAFAYFDWALIILSSLTGAVLLVQTIPVNFFVGAVIFCILLVAGIIVQSGAKQTSVTAKSQDTRGKGSRYKE